MEDADGYMVVQPTRNVYMDASPKTQGPSKCWKITVWVTLGGSIALNVALIVLLIVFQIQGVVYPSTSTNSCGWIPGTLIVSMNFDPETAHRRIVISRDRKTATWGKEEQSLPESDKRFNLRVWVLGQTGFKSGKHCWEVEIKHDGEWAVGVARESVKRKGLTDFSTKEGIWAIAEYWEKANYIAFTEPQHTKISFEKKPRRIRVFVDYLYQEVEFFNVETKTTIFLFSNASFSGEIIYPWFRVWDGTELMLHP
ncbi:butyrophilin subfamily 1 member A1-like [Crotalus tigris]|uniref:butyrophilin subfamily 1 member A1-like n=1 Tax=Crotalus tigris TaxID=88082 RepID=UPI00192F3ABA|nr:butyrophilin subfamily 1 member A1-like [Crotalus tigris]XP_039211301.1 butyrophilin subfamily 1 member A1-like [Crotalus tigris]